MTSRLSDAVFGTVAFATLVAGAALLAHVASDWFSISSTPIIKPIDVVAGIFLALAGYAAWARTSWSQRAPQPVAEASSEIG